VIPPDSVGGGGGGEKGGHKFYFKNLKNQNK